MIRLRRVHHRSAVLWELQDECLPGDRPYRPRPEDVWFVAYDDDQPVAFAGARPTEGDPTSWFLCRSGVIESARGHGLQKRLIRARLRAIQAAGGNIAYTYTAIDNPASANSLIAEGFRAYVPEWRWAGDMNYWRRNASR